MDEIRELTLKEQQSTAEDTRRQAARKSELEQASRRMLEHGNDPVPAAKLALECVLEVLGFERGFVFVCSPMEVGAEADATVGDPELGSIQPLASRSRAESSEWADVRNPEFAVNRSVIKRAVVGRKLVAVNDCLLQPTPESGESHRAVLCLPFELTSEAQGVLYLDRALGQGEVGDAEGCLIEAFSIRCLPIVKAAYLGRELERLRALRDEEESPPDDSDTEEVGEDETSEAASFHGIVGSDEKLLKIFRVVEKIKDAELNVCIFGESGTGKELLARSIHDASRRRGKCFVGENCGAIPENLLESELFGHVKGAFTGADEERKGLFEVADGGTLFLDEIGDMSEGMQRKLLRVLQEGVIRPIGAKHTTQVDVRVICASNRDLRLLVQKGTFRSDLFYRLNVITLELPPLRDRPGDIPLLVKHFTSTISREEGIRKRLSQSALRALVEYSWPGNIRELSNVVRRALLTSPNRVVARKDVVGFLSTTTSPRSGENMERDDQELLIRIPVRDSFNKIVDECERVVLLNALKQCGWNKSRVTKFLKIPRQSLYNKIAKYQLERSWEPGR